MRPTAAAGGSGGGDPPIFARVRQGAAAWGWQRHLSSDVAEGVAALIAIGRRVGQLADPDAVHDDDDGSKT
jgi:hypothetical protein